MTLHAGVSVGWSLPEGSVLSEMGSIEDSFRYIFQMLSKVNMFTGYTKCFNFEKDPQENF